MSAPTLLLAVFSMFPWLSPPLFLPETPEQVEAELAQALQTALPEGETSLPEPGNPEADALMERLWGLCSRWTAAYLTQHPAATAEELAAAFAQVPARRGLLAMDALRLEGAAPPAYAVAVDGGWIGTFFVVAADERGRFHLAWDVKPLAHEHYAAGNQIGYWANTFAGYGSGPLTGTLRALPAGRNGSPRFAVEADSHPGMGGTYDRQFGVWEWDGREASSLFLESFSASTEMESTDLRFEQDRVRIPVKTHLKRLYSCGPCSDPQATWTLRITPDGVEDLGLELASPELGAADELMDRVIRRQDTSKLASPGAAKSLAAVLEGQLYDDGKDEGEPDYFLGMLTGWRVEPRSGGATLLLSTDEMPCTEFAFERRAAGLFFTGVTAVAWAEGEPNPCWRP